MAQSAIILPETDAAIVPVSNVRRWLTKATFALIDQGLISGSNFVMGVLLARWLGAEQYGAYALAFAIFILLSLVYQSLLLEPMSVFGPSAYAHRLREYTGTLIWVHGAIALATFLVMGAAALSMAALHKFGGLPSALLGAAVAAPCVLLFWLARRAYYLKLTPKLAAIGAVLYSVLMFGSLALLHHQHLMSPLVAFLVMALAALATSGYLLARFRPSFKAREGAPTLPEVTRENWTYGKWALASSIFMWVPWNIFYTLVASFSGIGSAGQLRALLNFALPIAQTYGAISLLFLPHAACELDKNGWSGVSRVSTRITLCFAAGGLCYWALVSLFRVRILSLLYAGQYADVAGLIPLIGLASLFWGAAQGPAIALRANKTPSSVFVMYFVAAIAAVASGVPLTLRFGLAGACSAMLIASAAAWITGVYCTRKRTSPPTMAVQEAA